MSDLDEQRRPRVLCVDDEPNVLEGLSLHLRRHFEVVTALSGQSGLDSLASDGTTAVVVSDMRMPGMDGATFLAHARLLAPDAVRILLTGYADVVSAIAAVNEGQIFRFLTKPCSPLVFVGAIRAAVEQHRLVTSERVLLEQTLHGSIKALTDVLALTNPVSFGRAMRIKRNVADLAEKLALHERWQLEVAAMFSQLGFMALPPATAEKVYYGLPLSESEHAMVGAAPTITERLLGNIPRLETVREILAQCPQPFRPCPPTADARKTLVQRAAQILRTALDFDVLEAQGNSPALAINTLRGRPDQYDPQVLVALADVRGAQTEQDDVRELPLAALRPGMVLASDVKMKTGTLVVARGYEITEAFLARLRNFSSAVEEPLRVIVPAGNVQPRGDHGSLRSVPD